MDFTQFVEWAFYGIISLSAIYGMRIMGDMRDSIEQLNIQMAVIISRHDQQEREIERLENRLTIIETRGSK